MEDETTTVAPVDSGETTIQGVQVDDQGTAVSLPEDNEETPAVNDIEKEKESETGAKALPDEDKLQSFAKGQGIEDMSELSAREKSLLKAAYDSKVEYTQKRQKDSELEKTMSDMSDDSAEQVAQATGQNPEVLKRIQRMEVKESIRDFWDSHPDARQLETEMAQIAVDSGLYGSPEAILKASYAMARESSLKSQGKQEALTSLAHKQQAAVPRGNAVNSAMTTQAITPQNVDQLVGQNDLSWFQKNREAINKAMAG